MSEYLGVGGGDERQMECGAGEIFFLVPSQSYLGVNCSWPTQLRKGRVKAGSRIEVTEVYFLR
jgi:hypothetical protein